MYSNQHWYSGQNMDKELLNHYKNTDYWFTVDDKTVTLRIGRKNNEFNRLCERFGCTTGTFITACNPQSQLLTINENKRRNKQLATRLEQMSEVYCFSGEGQSNGRRNPVLWF